MSSYYIIASICAWTSSQYFLKERGWLCSQIIDDTSFCVKRGYNLYQFGYIKIYTFGGSQYLWITELKY